MGLEANWMLPKFEYHSKSFDGHFHQCHSFPFASHPPEFRCRRNLSLHFSKKNTRQRSIGKWAYPPGAAPAHLGNEKIFQK